MSKFSVHTPDNVYVLQEEWRKRPDIAFDDQTSVFVGKGNYYRAVFSTVRHISAIFFSEISESSIVDTCSSDPVHHVVFRP